MYLTWFGNNSWLFEIANQRILLDPWFVGPLVFGNQSWFFKAEQAHSQPIPEPIDLILLSQGLPDHTHPPTLEVLDKNIPVWGSPNAIKQVTELGFRETTALEHGQSAQMADLSIEAYPGAPIGPLLTENAFVLRDRQTRHSIYYEPHGFHSPELKDAEPIDVAIVPLIDLTLPLVGAFIKGTEVALELATWVQPQVMIPTTVGGDITYSGWLNSLIGSEGDLETLRTRFKAEGLSAQILEPFPMGEQIKLSLSTAELNPR